MTSGAKSVDLSQSFPLPERRNPLPDSTTTGGGPCSSQSRAVRLSRTHTLHGRAFAKAEGGGYVGGMPRPADLRIAESLERIADAIEKQNALIEEQARRAPFIVAQGVVAAVAAPAAPGSYARNPERFSGRPLTAAEEAEHKTRVGAPPYASAGPFTDFPKFRAGDVVQHEPSGEEWVLAYSECTPDGEKVSACGWPESIAKASDCLMVKRATDEEHVEMLRQWARGDRHRDRRSSLAVAKRQLAAWEQCHSGSSPGISHNHANLPGHCNPHCPKWMR